MNPYTHLGNDPPSSTRKEDFWSSSFLGTPVKMKHIAWAGVFGILGGVAVALWPEITTWFGTTARVSELPQGETVVDDRGRRWLIESKKKVA